VVNLRVGLIVGEVHAEPPNHADNDAARATLVVACCRCRADVGYGMTSLSNRADDGTCTCKTNKLMRGVTMHMTVFYLCKYL
jgi:hypothetical protein